MAEEHGVQYFETSALTGDGISEMMDNIMSQVYDYKIVPEKEQAEKNGTPVQPETVQLHRASVHSKKKDDETSGAGCC